MFDEMWQEIQDMPGEIFDLDIPELKEEDFNLTDYINGEYDYWIMNILKVWYRHITGYWEKKLPHIPGANSKQFWNIINGNWH